MNPIFDRFQQNQLPRDGFLGNVSNVMSWFNQFRQNVQQSPMFLPNIINQFNDFQRNFQGDPEAIGRQLIESGQITKNQFQQLSNVANQFRSMIGK